MPTRYLKLLRILIIAVLSASVLAAAFCTAHWPIVGDAPLMHYVVFLMDHEKIPYREIIDINMPGTYALQWCAIHLLGPGAIGWRVFDFGLLAICIAAMVTITWRVDWLAGFFSGTLFALIHLRDGPTHTGQRDLMMTTFLLLACVMLFRAIRGLGGWPIVLFGIFAGIASTIKPSGFLFFVAFTVILSQELRSQERQWRKDLLIALIGFAVPIGMCVLFLMREDALAAFIATNRGIVAYHASLGRPSLYALLIGSFPSILLVVALPAIPVLVQTRFWKQVQGQCLVVGAILGAASYVIQGKGFPYHRYPTEAFLLLSCSLLLVPFLKNSSWLRIPALLGVLAGSLYLAPVSSVIASRYDWRDQEFNQELKADLANLGGRDLNQQVQCIDMTAGCLGTLYDMQIVQATGYLYDCYMFQTEQTPVSVEYRENFMAAIQKRPPKLFVVTNQECFTMARTWTLTQRWPAFDTLLRDKYTLIRQQTPPHTVFWWRHPAVPFSYRLYLLNGDDSTTLSQRH